LKSSQRTGEDFTGKYAEYGQALYRLCMVYLRSAADAEDVMQEAFIKLLFHAPRFADAAHEKRWLLRVAVNACKNRLGAAYRRNTQPMDRTEPIACAPEDSAVLDAVMSLPEKYRAAIHLHYFEGYAVGEVARMLSLGESAVKMRLSRGRAMLRLELEEE
jgi:RNA polymerase sigma factor (sigma-70 family)